jgi:hexokinase
MKPEAAFSARVRDGLLKFGVDIERIENRVNLGIPDMLVGVEDRFVVIETKVVQRGLKVTLRPHQIAFMARQSGKGRPCFVLVLQSGGTTLRPAMIHLYHGRDVIDLAAVGLRLPALRSWPSRGMPWVELFEQLSETKTP